MIRHETASIRSMARPFQLSCGAAGSPNTRSTRPTNRLGAVRTRLTGRMIRRETTSMRSMLRPFQLSSGAHGRPNIRSTRPMTTRLSPGGGSIGCSGHASGGGASSACEPLRDPALRRSSDADNIMTPRAHRSRRGGKAAPTRVERWPAPQPVSRRALRGFAGRTIPAASRHRIADGPARDRRDPYRTTDRSGRRSHASAWRTHRPAAAG